MNPEPCRSCGAPLAPDQRYCLACGNRRAGLRLPFLEILRSAPAAGPAVAGTAVVADPAPPPWTRTNAALLAGIGCLLLALGIGVLIGKSGSDATNASAPAPQVIRVGGAAPAAAAATGAVGGAVTAKKAAKKHKKAHGATPAAKSAKDSKATNPTLKKLNNLSPSEYQKQSVKLPKTVGTGGKPPPKVKNAKPKGGSFQEIG